MSDSPTQYKDCPLCGEQINAKAIKCKHCQSMLNDSQNDQQNKDCPLCGEKVPVSEKRCRHCDSIIDDKISIETNKPYSKETKLIQCVSDYQKTHRIKYPLPEQGASKNGILGFINKSINSIKGPSEVAFIEEITPTVLSNHAKYTTALNSDLEKPLFVLNTTFGMGNGLLISTEYLYFTVLPVKSFMGFGRNITNRISIKDIKSLVIGAHDRSLGTAYEGHEFHMNGAQIGWIRMGSGITFNSEALDSSTELFGILTKEVFSRN